MFCLAVGACFLGILQKRYDETLSRLGDLILCRISLFDLGLEVWCNFLALIKDAAFLKKCLDGFNVPCWDN